MTFASHKRSPLRKRLLILTAAIFGIGVLCYAWYGYRFPSWEEEVLLPDGRKIIVRQQRDYIQGYGTRKTRLTFSLPEMGGEQDWVEFMQPILMTVSKDGHVYVVGWPSGEKQILRYRHPRYGYVAFQWRGAGFERIPFLSIPEDLRQEGNLIRCLPRSEFVKWESKLQAWCSESGEYITGGSRRIDIHRMQDWALRQAERQNVEPLSE